jgi:hypothetical protein
MAKALYRFSDVEAKKAAPATVIDAVRGVLSAAEDACYCEIERFLLPPGVSGSRTFDQAYAVDALLKHDALHGGRIATIMESTGMSRRLLWDRLQGVLRRAGFQMSHGRLTGLLEDFSEQKKNGKDEPGQPDID